MDNRCKRKNKSQTSSNNNNSAQQIFCVCQSERVRVKRWKLAHKCREVSGRRRQSCWLMCTRVQRICECSARNVRTLHSPWRNSFAASHFAACLSALWRHLAANATIRGSLLVCTHLIFGYECDLLHWCAIVDNNCFSLHRWRFQGRFRLLYFHHTLWVNYLL